jgi:hypothetical protein
MATQHSWRKFKFLQRENDKTGIPDNFISFKNVFRLGYVTLYLRRWLQKKLFENENLIVVGKRANGLKMGFVV